MSSRIPSVQVDNLFKQGTKNIKGKEDVVMRNIEMLLDLTKVLRTSFGPNGRRKIVVNHLEKLFVTADAATISRELDIVHPAAKLLMMASQAQDAEMGDGTNLVNILTGKLLEGAADLIRLGLHPADIVSGYEFACDKAMELIKTLTIDEAGSLTIESNILKIILPVLMSKQMDNNTCLVNNICKAVASVMPRDPLHFNVDSVRVVKVLGGSLFESLLVKGMVFGREPEGSVKNVKNAKVAIYSCPVDIATTETKGTVLMRNADELASFSKGEEQVLKKLFTDIKNTGVNVIVSGSSVGDLALHYCNELGIMVVKVLSKFDLRRLCRVTGSCALLKLSPPTLQEIGTCNVVETIEIGSDRCTVFRQENDDTLTSTIVLRGATSSGLDDVERSIDDAINSVKAATRNPKLVAGAGACEIELAKLLYDLAATTSGLAQYGVCKFAEALEAVPYTLAENAGMDTTLVISELHVAHQKGIKTMGIVHNDDESGVKCAVQAKIYDLLSTKSKAILLAAETALTVLRIDQIIMSKQAGGPKPKENKNWDED